MPITSAELVFYQSANMPENDTSTSGGAIATTGKVKTMPMASASVPKVASSAAGDTTQTITVTGRDAAGTIVSEVETLNGTTQVNFSQSFERILKVVLSATTTGNVTLYMNDGSTEIVVLEAGITSNRRLFYDASSSAAQETRYEKVYGKNEDPTLTLNSAIFKLTADPQARIKIGVESSADQSVANRDTAPGSVSFVDDNVDVDITSLAAGASKGLWVQQQLPADDAAFKNTFTLELSGTTT